MAGPLEHVRALCLALPEVSERVSHGRPAFFVRNQRAFVRYMDDHHSDGRLALWCAAPEGMQERLIEGEPEHYFRPPYVGHRGLGRRPPRSRPGPQRGRRSHRGGLAHRGPAVARGHGRAKARGRLLTRQERPHADEIS